MSPRLAIAPLLATFLVPAIASAQPSVTTSDAPSGPNTGLALELRMDTGDYYVDEDLALPVTDGGLFVGYQMPRVSVGVGFDFGRLTDSSSFGTEDMSESVTTFLITPGVRFTAARSADGRAELIGAADIGLGQMRFSDSDGGEGPEPITRFRLQGGPGVRYWVHPSFALGATTGLRYDRMSVELEGLPGETGTAARASTSLFTSVQLTGVF